MGMSKKRPKSKRPDDQDVRVLTPVHARLKALADKRVPRVFISALATAIIEAYLDHLEAGTDWLEVAKVAKGGG